MKKRTFELEIKISHDQKELIPILANALGGKIIREGTGVNNIGFPLARFTIELENNSELLIENIVLDVYPFDTHILLG